jgi:hypothetical protein
MRTAVDILLAEDSDDDALLTLHALRRTAPELRVLRVTDGEQALHFLFGTGANEYCIKPADADCGGIANILGRWLAVPDTPRMQGS